MSTRKYVFGYVSSLRGYTPTKVSLDGNQPIGGAVDFSQFFEITEEEFEGLSLDELTLKYPLNATLKAEGG